MNRRTIRLIGIAAGYGFLAGALAAVVLKLMFLLSDLIWADRAQRWYVFAVIVAGGAVIAALRHWTQGHEAELAGQLRDAANPLNIRRRLVLLLAAGAVVAVAFGGAVGPEAGILAVVAEQSALVSLAIGRSAEEKQLVGEAGAAGALSGIYGSPPGGAAMTEDDASRPPRPLLFLAGTAGLLGFLLCARLLLEGDGMRIHLPPYVSSFDAIDMLQAIVPAILGGLAGLAFVSILPWAKALLERVGSVAPQTMAGTLAFAALAAAFPILRFSGHHEMEAMLEWGRSAGMITLLALGLLKALALAICLASGWRGGAAFPLLFAGAAAGGAALSVMPDMAPTLALVAGMTAAITAGMGKPAAAVLIMAFLVSPFAPGPLLVGALVGYGYSRIGPKAELH